MDKNKCTSCGKPKCSCKNKDFTKAVIEIDNPEHITLMRKIIIPASMGDDTTVPPVVGKYHNVLLYYEANSKSYLYSSDGIPTQLNNGITNYEDAINLPQINGNTLIGDKTGEELGLQDKLTAGDGVTLDGNTISITDIKQYAHFFDTVADMKAATNLAAGDYAKTLGFHTINDGGEALYKITDTGTANEMDVIAVGNLYASLILEDAIDPMQIGAAGNGTTDDTNYIQYILDSISRPIKFTHTHFVTGVSSTKPHNMFADKSDFGLVGNNSGYVLRFIRDNDDPADYRNYYLKNIFIAQRGSGDALLLSGWGDRLMEFNIENCKIFTPYTNPTGYAIHAINSLAHSVIDRNTIQGNGIKADLRDRNVISNNMFFGNGYGCYIDVQSGCLDNTISQNTFSIYGKNAIYIANGEQILIQNNQIEYPDVSDQATTYEGMIVLVGVERRCKAVQIIGNNLGGGTHLNTLINVLNADDTIIDRNRLVAVNTQEILINAGAVRTVVRNGNWGVPQVSNPRTSLERKYIVTDNGQGTMGVWKSLPAQGSATYNVDFMKTEDGLLHFKPIQITSLSNLTVCTLPLYFRPAVTVRVKAVDAFSTNETIFQISYTGDITLPSAPSAQGRYFMQAEFSANRYAS